MVKGSNKFIEGAAILGVAGVVIKLLGAIFRIPITNWIGDTGMAYYGVAYTIYGALLVLSTAGIPVAISRLVSESIAVGQYGNAHKTFKVAIRMLFIIGVISFAFCFFFGSLIAKLVGNADASLAIKAISPALLFVPLFSALRGYFQGWQNMKPTAVSEITEQLVRVSIGLYLAYKLLDYGIKESAAGASFGASAGSIAGLGVILIIYGFKRKVVIQKINGNNQQVSTTKQIIRKIITIAIPIIIGCEIMPIMTVIDTGIIMNRLQATGWTMDEATSLYGLLSGFCNSLITFPQVFTQAVAVSLVPAVASAFRVQNKHNITKNIKLGYRTTMIMAFPCAFGILALAEPILFLLYPHQRASASAATSTLMILSISVIFLAITQTSIGILQSIGKQTVPVKNLAMGCIGKIIATYILVGIHSINVKGAAVGTLVAYFIAFILNNLSVKKYTDVKISFTLTYLRPAIAAVIMSICVFSVHKLTLTIFGNSLATLCAIIIGAVVYIALIFMLKVITKEELKILLNR